MQWMVHFTLICIRFQITNYSNSFDLPRTHQNTPHQSECSTTCYKDVKEHYNEEANQKRVGAKHASHDGV